ncbi:MAG: D-alanine--D-alanine ligase [bacterium]|nr:D-alanine--D-alanine ligase [bacterium]
MITKLKNKLVGVISGGFSKEREVSIRSGHNVYESLCRSGYNAVKIDPVYSDILEHNIDAAFIALHGKYGEDGTIQAFLEHNGIPYTGSGIKASSLAINKLLTKQLLLKAGLPAPEYFIPRQEGVLSRIKDFPVVVKPVDEGSSFGVDIVDNKKDLINKTKNRENLIVEQYISGQEITIGILQTKKDTITVLPVLELVAKNRFYDYQAKYTNGMTEFILPASISEENTSLCKSLALNTYQLLGCRGMARVDMILNPDKGPFILEINTIPGLTNLSDLPAQAKHAGISFDNLIEILLESAFF